MKTLARWTESKKDLGEYLGKGPVQVDEDLSDYMLGVVPPIMPVKGNVAASSKLEVIEL